MAFRYVKSLLLIFLALQVSLTFGQVTVVDKPDILSKYKWQNRLLLVFAPDMKNQAAQEQLNFLKQAKSGLTDRDLIIIPVTENKIEGAANASAKKMRQQFQVKANAFTLILIGKDGGEKYRTAIVVKPIVIFNIIDAMPMRQSEMKRN